LFAVTVLAVATAEIPPVLTVGRFQSPIATEQKTRRSFRKVDLSSSKKEGKSQFVEEKKAGEPD
jgi:hypothetical protein